MSSLTVWDMMDLNRLFGYVCIINDGDVKKLMSPTEEDNHYYTRELED